MPYLKFFAMVAAATVLMNGLMYLNAFAPDHVWYSQTHSWMALAMGAVMAIVMLAFMWRMYPRTGLNAAILVAAVAVFAASLYVVRSQVTVDDESYMKAMIPHHSTAVMTSMRARIRDPRVRNLADRIIESQQREIGEMAALIAELERNPPAKGAATLPPRARQAARR